MIHGMLPEYVETVSIFYCIHYYPSLSEYTFFQSHYQGRIHVRCDYNAMYYSSGFLYMMHPLKIIYRWRNRRASSSACRPGLLTALTSISLRLCGVGWWSGSATMRMGGHGTRNHSRQGCLRHGTPSRCSCFGRLCVHTVYDWWQYIQSTVTGTRSSREFVVGSVGSWLMWG